MQIIIRFIFIVTATFATVAAVKLNNHLYAGLAVFISGCYLSILTDEIREAIFKHRSYTA